MYFNISVLFIVDITSILKLVFPTAYCFCPDGHLGGCAVEIVVAVVVLFYLLVYSVYFLFLFIFHLFIYLIFLLFQPLFLSLLSFLSSLLLHLLLLLVCVCVCVCVCLYFSTVKCSFDFKTSATYFRGTDQRCYVVSVIPGASAEFFHLHF